MMTKAQKTNILEMREEGIPYKVITEPMGMPLGSVKMSVSRHKHEDDCRSEQCRKLLPKEPVPRSGSAPRNARRCGGMRNQTGQRSKYGIPALSAVPLFWRQRIQIGILQRTPYVMVGYIYRWECHMHDESSRMVYGAFNERFMRSFYEKLAIDDETALTDCAPEICRRLDALLIGKLWNKGNTNKE